METKNEKELRVYERPEVEIMVINFGRICGGTEDGQSGGGDDPWDEEE